MNEGCFKTRALKARVFCRSLYFYSGGMVKLLNLTINNMDDTKKDVQRVADEALGEKFKVLTNASPDCIKLFNLENKIVYMNPGGLEEHRFKSLEDAIGFDWTESIVPGQREEIRRKIKESVEERRAVSLDVEHLSQYATREWCSLIVSPVFDDAGKVKYFVGISRDITDRRQSEERMKKYIEEQDALNKMMVNRELRMIELKKEKEELRKKCELGEKGNPVV
jgi:PAS domain S-box-containing protein